MNARRSTITVKELQEILQIGANSAYNLVHSKVFPVLKVGHSYRIPAESFYSWLDGQQNTPAMTEMRTSSHSGAAKY